MNINLLLDVQLGQPTGNEPVTLAQAKSQLKIDFTTDDALITALISAARSQLERYTGVSLVQREVVAVVKLTGENWFELPYGPVDKDSIAVSTVSIGGSTPEAVTSFDVVGNEFVSMNVRAGGTIFSLSGPDACNPFSITYDAGYADVPPSLSEAVLHQVVYLYEHRGDESGIDMISPTAGLLARLFRRTVI